MRLANMLALTPITLGPGATSIDVGGKGQVAIISDAGGNAISSIANGVAGDVVFMTFADALTHFAAGAARFENGEAFYPQAHDVLELHFDGSAWNEVSRKKFSHAPIALTLGVGATAIDLTTVPTVNGQKFVKVTGDGGGNNITSFTAPGSGNFIRILFVDSNVTLKSSLGVFAGGADISGSADVIVTLFYDGTTVREVSRGAAVAYSVSPVAATAITLAPGATAIDITAVPVVNGVKFAKITGDGGKNAITSFTGFGSNNVARLIFADALVTIKASIGKLQDNDDFISATDATMTLSYDGTTVRELSRAKPTSAPTALTLGVGASALALATVPDINGIKRALVTSDAGGNTLTSITGLLTGQVAIVEFADALSNITVAAAKFENNLVYYPAAGDMIVLFHDGTNIRELSRRTASHAEAPITLGAGASAIVVTTVPVVNGKMRVVVTGDGGGNNVTAITGMKANTELVIRFVDSNVTIKAALGKLAAGADFGGTADDMMVLFSDGTTIREISRSANA